MSAFVRWGLPEWVLVGWAIVNPIEACRLAALPLLDPDASFIGPVGAALLADVGRGGLIALATASLLAWSGLGLFAGSRLFQAEER